MRPSILFLNRVFPPDRGATGRLLAEAGMRFAGNGWRVTVVCDGAVREGGDGDPMIRVVRTGAGCERPGAGGYIASLMRLTKAALCQGPQDVVVTMTDPPLQALAGPLVAARLGARLIHWSHDLYPDLFPMVGVHVPQAGMTLLRRAMVASLRRHAAVIAIHPDMRRKLVERGVPAALVRVHANWAQRSFSSGEATQNDPKVGSDRGQPFVLYAGNLGMAHPVEIIPVAARILARRLPDARVLIVGDGRRREELARACRAGDLGNVDLLPPLPDAEIVRLSRAARLHLCLQAAGTEGLLYPCKIHAAGAAGRPILLAGPSEAGGGREAGVTRTGPDGEALAATIVRLFEDDAEYDRLRQEARAADRARPPGQAIGDFAALVCRAVDADPIPRSLHSTLVGGRHG